MTTNFPNGFAQGITVRNVPLLSAYPGKVFWVDSTAALTGARGTFDKPFATIASAMALTTATDGDIIVCKSGHAETVSAAAGVTLSTAGVALVGLGSGASRPTLNFTATGSTFTITAANTTVYNFLFTGGIDAVVSPIVISAADVALLNCEYRDVTGQCTDCILTTAAANRLLIKNFRYDGDTVAGTNAGIAIVGGDRITIEGLRMDGNFAVAGIDIRTTATTDLEVRDVVFRTRNAACIFLIDTITASTGMIGPAIYIRLLTNAANITEAITGATFVLFDDIYVVNAANEKAMLINWTASTDA